MKSLLSLVAFCVAAIVLFLMAPMSADTARGAEGGPTTQGTVLPQNLLDGKTFVAQSGEKGKKGSNKDTIAFRDGRFLSEGCVQWGFGDAAYVAGIEGDGIRFQARTVSPTHGAMAWSGLVKGDTIEATSIWTRERWYWKMKREYWYSGESKK
ncbi:MAG TPA: hypothetical protein DDX05_06425 [Deltaproteobacteria bacterium]|nr:MAG: hypothetical protein A2X90_02570 [Deltaproteobacteria bacterium GWA2_65_63]OGP28050.1 MAG: hypothetical protein A2X91_10505 [Deltaproteobacteria bacterium GWB2_65_81]OGP36775.1 MAG: hypothetical protein A2X98_02170 [Deltaproteobacteria bacterium GWC2_66_88]HAM33160.1 hypothetical protein [Deltaproteobacteria bacterium]HBG73241.1 hypothetical protein [Deltaproteobacteria bacterium]